MRVTLVSWAAAVSWATMWHGSGPAFASAAYQCKSDVDLGPTVLASQKGIAMDDNTMRWCVSQIPEEWPNAAAPMTSIRLFRAWDKSWHEENRVSAWDKLVAYISSKNAKVLIGTQISCSDEDDLQSWAWTKALLQRLQPHQVMGLAIGNELELLQFKDRQQVPEDCLQHIWEKGYLWRTFQRFVGEFDALGFGEVPVTSVFTGHGLSGNPFHEKSGNARVNSFMTNVTDLYSSRFAFAFNLYPYFNPGHSLDQGSTDECSAALAAAKCWGDDCFVPAQARQVRMKMEQLTGTQDGIMWIGETGWSTPMSASLTTQIKGCAAWSSLQTFQDFYEGFLSWDLSIGGGMRPPDHAFWFTMRDSVNFGTGEHFGLIAACDDPACKVHSAGYEVAEYALHMVSQTSKCGDQHLYDGWVHAMDAAAASIACRNKCTLEENCKYYSIWPHSFDVNYWCRTTSFCNHIESTAPLLVSTHNRLGMPSVPTSAPTPAPTGPTPRPTPAPAHSTRSPTQAPPTQTPVCYHQKDCDISAWCHQNSYEAYCRNNGASALRHCPEPHCYWTTPEQVVTTTSEEGFMAGAPGRSFAMAAWIPVVVAVLAAS